MIREESADTASTQDAHEIGEAPESPESPQVNESANESEANTEPVEEDYE